MNRESQAVKRPQCRFDYDPINNRWIATPMRVVRHFRTMFELRRNAAAARRAFPNATGNYAGKRTPAMPRLTPTARELFNRLAACYSAAGKAYRNPPHAR